MLVISGMTGSGKSKLAQSLAQILDGVVVCGDSVQLNKGLDILTNKSRGVLLTGRYDI